LTYYQLNRFDFIFSRYLESKSSIQNLYIISALCLRRDLTSW
jgi:hypothetical protein